MKKVLVLGFFLFLLIVTSVIYAETEQLDLKVQFEKQFPNFKVDSISLTPIDGIYEIIGKEGNQIIYWAPKGDGYLIFGEIWTTKGESLTAKRRQELVMKKISDLDLSKAIKVGKGKTKVITFSDPECPFCKKAYEFLSKRSDITEYVFLLPFHQGSKEKIAYVLCSKDKEKAYREVMESNKQVKVSESCMKEAEPVISDYVKTAAQLEVRGTPTFFIGDTVVPGANIPFIESLLNKKTGGNN